MASTIDKIKNDIVEAMNASQKRTSAYDTEAEIVRVDGNTAWVHIAGGVTETPVALTINAKKGDKVQVRVTNGGAWLMGNATAPPTDDAKANEADKKAAEAKYLAVDAADAAIKADIAAQDAETAAADAKATADSVHDIAVQAQEDADNASKYAARALGNLSTVQSVTETLTWITQHGTMALTTDVALDPTHVYFVVDAGGDYVVGGVTYAIVTEPDVDDIGTYYELTIDESLNNYVGTHLALTSEGLWLLPASTGTNRVLVATGAGSVYTTAGTYIIDNDGTTVLASFRADGATIGQVVAGEYNTNIDSTGFDIRDNAKSVAKFGVSARIGDESSGGSKVIVAPDSFTLYSKEDSTVFKTGVDSGGSVKTNINIGSENTQIVIDSTTIANASSANVSGSAILPALNSVSNNVNFSFKLGTFKKTNTGTSYISITNSITFVKGTSDVITDNGITISYNGSDTLAVSGSYTNNTGATLTLVDNMIRVRGSTAAITVPLYDTMINGNAIFNIDGGNTVIGLPLKASQQFDDYELYQAIVALGWEADVMAGLSFTWSTETRSVGNIWVNTITTVPNGMPITCTSDNTAVVIISGYDPTGQPYFKAVGAGTCTLTATINVGGVIYSATCSVTVT